MTRGHVGMRVNSGTAAALAVGVLRGGRKGSEGFAAVCMHRRRLCYDGGNAGRERRAIVCLCAPPEPVSGN